MYARRQHGRTAAYADADDYQILRAEKKTRDNAPEVMQEDVKQGGTTKPSTRTFSTLARRAAVTPFAGVDAADQFNPSTIPSAAQQAGYADELSAASNIELPVDSTSTVSDPGHKFPLPSLPLPREHVKDYRYDPVVTQITHLLMKDGKKSVAQRNMAVILNILRTSPAPRYDPSRPLLPGAPPASHLPLNPSLYLTLAIDSVAPLLRIRSQRGAAGGGVALQIPVPLSLQQRRRTAFMWVLDSVSKKRSRSSGRDMFAQRVAEELISIVEGRSSVWEKRLGVHKIATTARANLKFGRRKR